MSRFELSGWVGLSGGPMPGEALPDEHSSNTAPLVLQLETGDFHPEEYMSFGYNRFEAWCIGAAGGYGGNEVGPALWDTAVVRPRMSNGDWSKYKELMHIYDAQNPVNYTKPGPGGTVVPATLDEWLELSYPNHDPFNVTTFSNAHLGTSVGAYGGGGGGGGLHVVSGLLEDLPQPTPVVVGVVGANGATGQGHVAPDEIWEPIPNVMLEKWPTTETRLKFLNNYFNEYQYKYPEPHNTFTGGPSDGEDGGTSTFGDVSRASGGKGGGKSTYWPSGVKKPYGPGGNGGLGDRDDAGGGGAGDPGIPPDGGHNGSNGSLDSVLLIGGGGGGGRGSTPGDYQLTNLGQGPTWQLVGNRFPTNGGRGSYSYADTSVWGPPGLSNGDYGGSGGGAHRSGLKFGSYAPGYSPNGAVILRIFKA